MHSLLNHPSLIDCRRLFLRNYEVWINIGVHDFEKRGEQRVLINVDLYVPLASTRPRTDQLDEVLDYDFIRRTIAERASKGHVHLQETLCDDVARADAAAPAGARRRACRRRSPTSIPTAMRSGWRCSTSRAKGTRDECRDQ